MITTVPDFIKTTQGDVLALFIANYELCYFNLTKQTIVLQPAQAEQLLIDSGTYMVWLNLLKMQSAAVAQLPQFATYPVLDYMAEPDGVTRLQAQPASCTILFSIIAGAGNIVIPAGTRIQSVDGSATFLVQKDIPVLAGTPSVSAICVCDTPGISGNGYAIGLVNVILDPQAYLTSAVSIDVSVGGADLESDDNMRQRWFLAPGSFTTAGSDDAYKYFAKSASPLILDVSVNNGGGGMVNIYPLVAGGVTPPEIIALVKAACNPKTVRPVSDTVNVYSPTVINLGVSYDIIAYSNVPDTTALVTASKAAVAKLMSDNNLKLGQDAVVSQIIAAAKIDGVYDIVNLLPAVNVVVDDTEVIFCTGVTATLTGINAER